MSELARFEPDEEGGMVPVRPGEVISIGEWVRAEDAEEAIVALKTKLADLEASQTRWVKCSERLPEKVGYYFTSARWVRWFQPDYQEWEGVRAWLENVPEFVP